MNLSIDYITIQVIVLVLHYGNIVSLPLWIVWFPTICLGLILFVILLVFVFLGTMWLMEKILE